MCVCERERPLAGLAVEVINGPKFTDFREEHDTTIFKRCLRPQEVVAVRVVQLLEKHHLVCVCVSVKRDLFIWQKRPINISISQVSQ